MDKFITSKKKKKILECFLTHETYSDIDGLNLFSKLKVLKRLELYKEARICSKCMYYFQNITNYTVTIASVERSFSKLKLIKSYLRSTMSLERLSGLIM